MSQGSDPRGAAVETRQHPRPGPHLVELSHLVEAAMVTYPDLPGPVIAAYRTHEESRPLYAPGTEFHIGRIEMLGNTGTYLDAPYHRYRAGADIADLELAAVADLETAVVRVLERRSRAIDLRVFESVAMRGRAVLVHTGWDSHWGTPAYLRDHPFLTADAAHLLAQSRATLVGIDSLNIDDTADGTRPAHSILLAAGIPVVEHLCGLRQLPDLGARFFAVPLRVRGMGSFPVRAFAIT